MWQLFHFPLCPFSRKVRLLLAEKGIDFELRDEVPWAWSEGFLELSSTMFRPATPLLFDAEARTVLTESNAIGEYFEEIVEVHPLLPKSAVQRAEARRVSAQFDQTFFSEVTAKFLEQKIRRRLAHRLPPDAGALRAGLRRCVTHVEQINGILANQEWLGGSSLTLADLSASAQLSVVDQLGGVNWTHSENVGRWYAAISARPSFRMLNLRKN